RKISSLAIADKELGPKFEAYDVPLLLIQDERMSEDLPFGSRGGAAIRHYFPLDGEYVARIVASFSGRDALDVRLDGVRIASLKPTGGGGGNSSMAPVQEIRFAAKAGLRVMGLSFVEKPAQVEGVAPSHVGGYGRPNAGVNRVEIGGPYNTTGTAE